MIRRIPDLLGKILPVGMCSARHPARMRARKCGLNCSPLPTSIPVSSTRYIVGDKSDIWAYMLHCYFMVTLIACTMLFAGLVVLIISLVLDIIYKTRFDLEYLGWCMILGAVWMLGESKAAPAVCFNASILSNMCFFVVMLCPVPLMFYIDSVQQGKVPEGLSCGRVYHLCELCTMHILTATEYRRFYLDNVLVPPGDRRNVPDNIYHHFPGSHQGNGETLQASADRTGSCHDCSHAGGDSSVSCCVNVRGSLSQPDWWSCWSLR